MAAKHGKKDNSRRGLCYKKFGVERLRFKEVMGVAGRISIKYIPLLYLYKFSLR